MNLQVVLPEGMAAESMHSAAGLQILAGEMMVHERTVEQVNLTLYTCLVHVKHQQLLTGSRLPHWEAPIIIAEQRKRFFLFFKLLTDDSRCCWCCCA